MTVIEKQITQTSTCNIWVATAQYMVRLVAHDGYAVDGDMLIDIAWRYVCNGKHHEAMRILTEFECASAAVQFCTNAPYFPTCQVRVVRFYVSSVLLLLLVVLLVSVLCRTSTATLCVQCSAPDLNREPVICQKDCERLSKVCCVCQCFEMS